jgi:hypothetical protein
MLDPAHVAEIHLATHFGDRYRMRVIDMHAVRHVRAGTLVIEPNRDPRLGRNEEGYSEDPYLCSQIAGWIVRGVQGDDVSAADKAVAGLCHYPGQSQPVSGFERGAMEISERTMRDVFLPPWVAGIKRFGALVFSQESNTILAMINLAFAQYWSLRSYNFLMDHELETAQKLLEKLPPYYRFWIIMQAYQRFSYESTDFDRDKISIVDSLYNVLGNIPQVETDWHLRTLHQNVKTVFKIEELHKTVETKIEHIESSYNSARDFLSTNFFILLNIIFLLSLVWSILDTFLLWKLSVK